MAPELQVRGDRFAAVARTVTPDGDARRWPVMTAVWPSYDDSQANTDRDLPVVVNERRA